jgi:hypothetical protein
LKHRQALPDLLEVANFNERRPEFERGADGCDSIVNNTNQIVLEEIRLEAVKRFLKISSKEPERFRSFCCRGGLSSRDRSAV